MYLNLVSEYTNQTHLQKITALLTQTTLSANVEIFIIHISRCRKNIPNTYSKINLLYLYNLTANCKNLSENTTMLWRRRHAVFMGFKNIEV